MLPLICFAYWLCCGLLLYVYVIYPVLMRVLATYFGKPVASRDIQPTVTIIVTAYNEEKSIRTKLDNLVELDYPSERVDVLVASDASSDSTEQIAGRYDLGRVTVLRIEGRLGKTACQNAAAAAASGEILVFTDATTRVDRDALRQLVAGFADPEVGCVAGRLAYISESETLTGRGGRTYWNYELRLRAAESALGSLIGVSGCLYAVRKRAYRAIDPNLISDFVVAMKMREQRLRTVLAADAACYESTLDRGSQELSMRVRVVIRSINALVRERRFLNPIKFGAFAWQLWSHKALRYASPLLWLAAYAFNVLLIREAPYPLYLLLLLSQSAVLFAGGVGFLLQGSGRELGAFGKPYYFLLTNVAALIAIQRYLRGERMVTWKPIR